MGAAPSVLIVGGGLGGLALAQGLGALGVPATVCERDAAPTDRPQGYRISLNERGLAALAALLPAPLQAELPGLEARGVGRDFTFASASGPALLRFARGAGPGAMTVSRPGLRALLARGLDVRWGSRLVGLAADGAGVEITLAGGERLRADLVVGCDGVHSPVRAWLAAQPGAGALPQPYCTHLVSAGACLPAAGWEAELPLLREGAAMFLGAGGHALFASLCEPEPGRRALLWALSWRDPARAADPAAWRALGRSPEGRLALWRECLGRVDRPGWAPALRRLVRETPPEAVVEPLVLNSTRLPRRPSGPLHAGGRVTLLGDAAHAMPPTRGAGGNQALDDARLLAAHLGAARRAGRLDWPALAAAYEAEMLARAGEVLAESEEAADMAHLAGPPARVRNAVLGALGLGARLQSRLRAA